MKTREFVIKTESLEIDYNDALAIDLIEEYLFEDLEVPAECIESLNINYRMIKDILMMTGMLIFRELLSATLHLKMLEQMPKLQGLVSVSGK